MDNNSNNKKKAHKDPDYEVLTTGGKKKITGTVMYANITFEYSMKEQNSGMYLYRGSVRPTNACGKTFKFRGNKAKDIMQDDSISDSTKRNRIYLYRTIQSNTDAKEEVLAIVRKAAKKIYTENPEIFIDVSPGNVTSENITFSLAVSLYASMFINKVHQQSSDERKETITKRLENAGEKLPDKPMRQMKRSTMASNFKKLNVGADTIEHIHAFWQFCLEEGICEGENPVIVPTKKINKSNTARARAMRQDELSMDQYMLLADKLERKSSGIDVGVALMMSGFKPADICKLEWKDVIFRATKDHVIIKLNYPERGGATVNYSRPMLPRTAEILRKRYNQLCKEYPHMDKSQWPVVTPINSKEKHLSTNVLVQEARRMLTSVAVKNEVLSKLYNETSIAAATTILGNTYERIIRDVCNLYDDEGTALFLLGRSFGSDTTSNNYTSFTCKPGEARLFDLLCCTRKEIIHRNTKSITENENGETIVRCRARRSYDYTTSRIRAVSMMPGEKIKLGCLHGITGRYEAKFAD